MGTTRNMAVALVCALAVATSPSISPAAAGASMSVPRLDAAAATLLDGRVLVTGGSDAAGGASSSVEILDPVAGSWTLAAPMTTARTDHDAVRLLDGRVLVVGGFNETGILASSEIFDPTTNTWTSAAPLEWGRRGLRLVTLPDGSVLASGGLTPAGCPRFAQYTVLRYEPAANRWTQHGNATYGRVDHQALLLDAQRVLLTGGGAGAEIYNVRLKRGEPAGHDVHGRSGETATVLANGSVLVVGGCCFRSPYTRDDAFTSPAALFDPVTKEWLPTGPMAIARSMHSATRLPDGRVLIAGGVSMRPSGETLGARGSTLLDSVEIFDPATSSWSTQANLEQPRAQHVAAARPDGTVLLFGGLDADGATTATMEAVSASNGSVSIPQASAPAEPSPGGASAPREPAITAAGFRPTDDLVTAVAGAPHATLPDGDPVLIGGSVPYSLPVTTVQRYDRVYRRWRALAPLPVALDGHTATTLPDGRILVVGGSSTDARTFVYEPDRNRWVQVAPMRFPRAWHTATLLADGRVLVAGGSVYEHDAGSIFSCSRASRSVQIYDPSSNTWSDAEPFGVGRERHQAVLLSDGRVLAAGGSDDVTGAEVYDPATDAWRRTRMMALPRVAFTLHALPDGRALAIGGCCNAVYASSLVLGAPPSAAELFDPTANAWIPAPPMSTPRYAHAATTLRDGSILVVGGEPRGTPGDPICTGNVLCASLSTEIYEPATGTWRPGPVLGEPRIAAHALALPTGDAVVAGGYVDRADGRPVYATPHSDELQVY